MSDGWIITQQDGRQVRVAVARGAAATWVFCDGHTWKVDDVAAETPRRGKGRGEASVMSPMPATVVAIHAAPGQSVDEGDTLIVLEAMKMELPIKAPRAGVVKAIHCAKGELVQPGVNLIEIA